MRQLGEVHSRQLDSGKAVREELLKACKWRAFHFTPDTARMCFFHRKVFLISSFFLVLLSFCC